MKVMNVECIKAFSAYPFMTFREAGGLFHSRGFRFLLLLFAVSSQVSAQDTRQQAQLDELSENSTLNANQPAGKSENQDTCRFYQEDEQSKHDQEWIDEVRTSTHGGLCKSVLWIDGLFGDDYDFNDREFRGKISVGFRQDEDDGFDPRLRVKIRTKLPNVSNKFNAFLGRVEEDSFISNTEVNQDQLNTVGLRSVNDDDAEWLVGIGYRHPNRRENGFDYSIGAKLSSGLNPYAKLAYRHVFVPADDHLWKTTQTVFWRRDEGYGLSSNVDYIHLLGDHDILEWDLGAKYTENSEQWEWVTSGTWHHSFSEQTGVSSRAYVRGEEENPVSIPEFGLTLTYVRPFLRPWLSIETGIDFRWEKEAGEPEYKSATRVGVQFVMLLGDYYNRVSDQILR